MYSKKTKPGNRLRKQSRSRGALGKKSKSISIGGSADVDMELAVLENLSALLKMTYDTQGNTMIDPIPDLYTKIVIDGNEYNFSSYYNSLPSELRNDSNFKEVLEDVIYFFMDSHKNIDTETLSKLPKHPLLCIPEQLISDRSLSILSEHFLKSSLSREDPEMPMSDLLRKRIKDIIVLKSLEKQNLVHKHAPVIKELKNILTPKDGGSSRTKFYKARRTRKHVRK